MFPVDRNGYPPGRQLRPWPHLSAFPYAPGDVLCLMNERDDKCITVTMLSHADTLSDVIALRCSGEYGIYKLT